jgi:peptidoglycan/xylan/chitin deacetylase (PgdA/CDA1 family)
MIAALKRSSFSVSRHVGLNRIVADSVWRSDRLLVLCYHGVAMLDEHLWNPELYIAPATLARRFEILANAGCNLLSLDDAVRRLYAGTLPKRAVTLTFDDGFHDFRAQAHPILRRYGYPSTVYCTTLRVEQNHPIPQLLGSYLLWKHRMRPLDARGITGLDRVYELATRDERDRVIVDMLAQMHGAGMRAGDKDAFLREIAVRLDVDYDAVLESRILRLMTSGEVREMAGAGVAIELHTHSHRTPEELDAFLHEVRLNRRKLSEMTGRTPRHFCYPSGVCHPGYVAALEAEGVESATTCDPELASRTSHRLLLPRFVDSELVADLEFEAWVTGAASWLRGLAGHRRAIH